MERRKCKKCKINIERFRGDEKVNEVMNKTKISSNQLKKKIRIMKSRKCKKEFEQESVKQPVTI